MAWLQLQSQFYLETKFLFHQNCLFHYKAIRSMTRIPIAPVYPSFLFIFQEEKIIAEIKKWNSKYCILISDSCFQCLYADRKFWSRRYLFPHLCIRISDNTGYPDREFFFLIQEERDSFKELIAKKDQLNRMQRSVAKTFQEVLELTGSLCFMFRSTPKQSSLHPSDNPSPIYFPTFPSLRSSSSPLWTKYFPSPKKSFSFLLSSSSSVEQTIFVINLLLHCYLL